MTFNLWLSVIVPLAVTLLGGAILYYAIHRREGNRDKQINDLQGDVTDLRDDKFKRMEQANEMAHRTFDARIAAEASERRKLRDELHGEFVKIRELSLLRETMENQTRKIDRLAEQQAETRAVLDLMAKNIGIAFGKKEPGQ